MHLMLFMQRLTQSGTTAGFSLGGEQEAGAETALPPRCPHTSLLRSTALQSSHLERWRRERHRLGGSLARFWVLHTPLLQNYCLSQGPRPILTRKTRHYTE